LTEVTVTGVRESQIRAIELKRLAPNIQDSISAESIGQLPDVTITDSLQRITGVQINRDAGVAPRWMYAACLSRHHDER